MNSNLETDYSYIQNNPNKSPLREVVSLLILTP